MTTVQLRSIIVVVIILYLAPEYLFTLSLQYSYRKTRLHRQLDTQDRFAEEMNRIKYGQVEKRKAVERQETFTKSF